MNPSRIFDLILYYLCLPLAGLSFILIPLTNDSRIFLSSEAIADRFYAIPYGWDAAYEVKPIGNRILNWVFYKVANFFVPFTTNHYTEFGWAVKATALLVLIICCWYIASRITFPYAFPFLFLVFVCMGNFGIMMSEWFAVLFSLVAVALFFEWNENWQVAAGALCFAIALLKSITVLMVIPTVYGALLLGAAIDWRRAIAGYLAAGFLFLALCLTVWPYSIMDMLMSRYIAHVGHYNWQTIFAWFWITQDDTSLARVLPYYLPGLLVGIIIGIFVFFHYWGKADWRSLGLFTLMWAVPVGIVLIQSEFIIYHYLVMLLPGVVSVMLFMRIRRTGK
jgi:hypothetical protein